MRKPSHFVLPKGTKTFKNDREAIHCQISLYFTVAKGQIICQNKEVFLYPEAPIVNCELIPQHLKTLQRLEMFLVNNISL